MLPSSPLTDPDVRISRFRFFTGEVRSQQRSGVTVDDTGSRQGMAPEQLGKAAPGHGALPVAPGPPLAPAPCDFIGIPAQSTIIARDAVVGIVAPHHRAQMGVLCADRRVPVLPAPRGHRRQRAGVTLFGRYLPHHALALPGLPPDVAEAQEGERSAIRFRMLLPIGSCEAEVDEARLGRMKPEPIPSKTLAQHVEDPLGVVVSLERQDGIVGKPDKGTSPLSRGLTSLSNHSSSTWCRKTLESRGEITPP